MWWRTIVQSEVTFHLEGTLSCLSTTGANQNHFMVFFFFTGNAPKMALYHIFFSTGRALHFLPEHGSIVGGFPPRVSLWPLKNQTFSVCKLASAPRQKCLVPIRLSGMDEGSLSLPPHTQYMSVCVTASSSGFRVWGWDVFSSLFSIHSPGLCSHPFCPFLLVQAGLRLDCNDLKTMGCTRMLQSPGT